MELHYRPIALPEVHDADLFKVYARLAQKRQLQRAAWWAMMNAESTEGGLYGIIQSWRHF